MARLAYLLMAHVEATMPGCDVLVIPGVIPADRPERNELVPDIALTCEKARKDSRTTESPIILIEILPPSNEAITRRNADSDKTMPSVKEVLLDESASGVKRRLRATLGHLAA